MPQGRISSFRRLAVMLLLAAWLSMPGAGLAQSITNQAQASWKSGGQDLSVQSNTVTFDVIRAAATLETMSRATEPSGNVSFAPTLCNAAPLYVAGAVGSANPAATLGQSSQIRVGETLYFRLVFAPANANPSAIDRITVVLTSQAGDRERVEVAETATDSGIFIGAIPTAAVPPQPVAGDCRLGVAKGDEVELAAMTAASSVVATAAVAVLADPYGLVFDSEDGSPVSGVRVTLVDAASGLPAKVFADDGVTPYPGTVISGQAVTDSRGTVYPMGPGEYRFPLAPVGTYRLQVEPGPAHTAPSRAGAAQLAGLVRPDGGAFEIGPASFGGDLALSSMAPVRVDIPVDRPPTAVSLTKTASRQVAVPGDVVFYTIVVTNPDPARSKRGVIVEDRASGGLRLRPDSVRIDGQRNDAAVVLGSDGRSLTITVGTLAPAARQTITYAMTVRPDALAGQAVNRAEASDLRGTRAIASAMLRIERDTIGGRVTLIGQIRSGDCTSGKRGPGVPGVRLVLEDGSFAITDADGRYHFEGLVPGTHVVQAQAATLPAGGRFVSCTGSARSAGSASSRFITGQGGSLATADFLAVLPEEISANRSEIMAPASDQVASGGSTDWFANSDGPIDFLFPAIDHNPRAPAVRVVIRHRAGQQVELAADGRTVESYAFDGTRVAPGGNVAISAWRGLPISGERLRLTATVRNPDGSVAANLARDVHYAATPAQVTIVPEASRLVADGTMRPLLAIRVTDRRGRPVHAGIAGEFLVNAPYESAQSLDARQSRALAGLGRGSPQWVVKGDDGMAYIELAPTMVSGALRLEFSFSDGTMRRRQQVETWIVPGAQQWTLVGLAEGAAGARTIADNMERAGRFDSDLGTRARLAFYAKGRVLGRFLLTAAYDSAKQPDDQRLLGAIDPSAYYTVFADGSDRRFDAASRRKLYVRIETAAFHALFGDFDTGFDQTQLARYQRRMTGLKGALRSGSLQAQGFAAKAASRHRRDTFQGGGLSGPYRLSSRAMLANSETVTLEVRDRFRSEVIVSQRRLVRFVDYDIDHLSGTITFVQPLLSTDAGFNPQFVVIDYEVDGLEGGRWNAGVRADFGLAGGKVRIGASLVSEPVDLVRSTLAGVDLRARLGNATELRAELAASRATEAGGRTDEAWLVELEHHDGQLDLLAYARLADAGFGLGQTNGAELGRRKIGVDARYSLTDHWSVTASAWQDSSLVDPARREALQLRGELRGAQTDARLGLTTFADRLRDGSRAGSTVIEGGVTRRLFDNQLELDASASLPLGTAAALDLPARHRLSARYALSPQVRLVGSYELAEGAAIRARTARAGVELSPWRGNRLTAALGRQGLGELGQRSFAAFGIAQSIEVVAGLTLDATLDSNRTLGGVDPARVLNPAHPAASGGNLGETGTIAEDYTALTAGGTYRAGRWTASLRGEWRNGALSDRAGLAFATIRQLGEGSMAGAGLTWTRATGSTGGMTESVTAAIAAAHRPAGAPLGFLTKLDYRADRVENAVPGELGPAGRSALTVNGTAASRRLVGSVSLNWSPVDDNQDKVGRSEFGLFLATRYGFDRLDAYDLKGWSLLAGTEVRIGLAERLELGAVGTMRRSFVDGTTSFAFGPQLAINPTRDVLVTIGYNISGFRDRDFGANRTTNSGLFTNLRMKFDAASLGLLGLR